MSPDPAFMREAIRLSRAGMQVGQGGPFGAVIVRDGEIIARGNNQVTTALDPTAHAEIIAIRAAAQALRDFRLAGCDIYTSCEPCPMCLAAIYWARLDRVFYANDRLDAARAGFDDDHIYREFTVPVDQRTVPIAALLREEALPVFDEWNALADKVPY